MTTVALGLGLPSPKVMVVIPGQKTDINPRIDTTVVNHNVMSFWTEYLSCKKLTDSKLVILV